ncbi:MAG: 50S ribosomal protein L10, partial [Desulfobacca sp. RBG_16_58_9]
ILEKIAKSSIGILSDFKGLKVEDLTRLRRQLREAEGELKVVKNTLLTRAAAGDSAMAPLTSQFTGPNALTLGYGDPVALTKVLIKFAQERPQLQIKAGVLGGQVLSAKDLDALSKLPAKEVLLAQLLGVLQAVPTALVTVLSGVVRNLLNLLVALRDQKTAAEPAEIAEPAEAAPPSEPAEAAEPSEAAPPSEPAEVAEPAEATPPSEPAGASTPEEPAAPAEPGGDPEA